jgi:hypothetical protein
MHRDQARRQKGGRRPVLGIARKPSIQNDLEWAAEATSIGRPRVPVDEQIGMRQKLLRGDALNLIAEVSRALREQRKLGGLTSNFQID